MTRYFVMLRNGSADDVPVPMVKGFPADAPTWDADSWSDELVLFETEAAATAAGDASPLGVAFGFEVYPW